jgi:periplasmic protein TonB
MFENLVESGSHKEDLSRKGSFLLVTTAIYGLLILTFVVATIWFTVAEMDTSDLELTTLVAPVPVPPPANEPPKEVKQVKPEANVDVRKALIAEVSRADLVPEKITTKALEVPPVRKGVTTVVGTENTNAVAPMPAGPGAGTVVTTPTKVIMGDEPPPAAPKPSPHAPISGGVLNGKALHLVQPAYPQIARQAHASGMVVVQVLIDENGNVVAAHAVSGHPLLQAVAVAAARASRFSPTKLSGQPVKVNGVIQYNFVAP